MRFHVAALAGTQTTRAFAHCAYTTKIVRFARMMESLGHHVLVYGSEESDAGELVTCVTKAEQAELGGVLEPGDNLRVPFDPEHPLWARFNLWTVAAMRDRVEPDDFVLLSAGRVQAAVAASFGRNIVVEPFVGYSGIIPELHHVFESYAWMHVVMGATFGAHGTRGRLFDAVIPNYFDPEDYPFSDEHDGYFLFLGRCNEDKGIGVAAEVARRLDVPLVVAGQGDHIPPNADYRGLVGVDERGKLLSRARAVFVPTLYLEPFGGVAVEAMLCGAPVITTDFGAFPETVVQGVSGFRCRTLAEFVAAAARVDELDRHECRRVGERYTTDRIRHRFEAYFRQLETLRGDGWYSVPPRA